LSQKSLRLRSGGMFQPSTVVADSGNQPSP